MARLAFLYPKAFTSTCRSRVVNCIFGAPEEEDDEHKKVYRDTVSPLFVEITLVTQC